jgi:hypothetical protein
MSTNYYGIRFLFISIHVLHTLLSRLFQDLHVLPLQQRTKFHVSFKIEDEQKDSEINDSIGSTKLKSKILHMLK